MIAGLLDVILLSLLMMWVWSRISRSRKMQSTQALSKEGSRFSHDE